MSDENKTESTDAPVAQDQSQLPDWARKAISEANSEAAAYRQKAKTAADEVTAKLTADFGAQLQALSDEKSAITAERNTVAQSYDKLAAALDAGVPGDSAVEFAALLQGTNKEEFKAHAEKLKAMFGAGNRVKAVDPSHGLTGEPSANPGDDFMRLIQNSLRK